MKEQIAQEIIRNDSLTQAPNDIISGYARGYYTVIQFLNNGSAATALISINAKAGNFEPAVPIQQFLTELRVSHKRVMTAAYVDNRIDITIRRPSLLKIHRRRLRKF